ncbi:Stk1 family PASTA domain-containing Ser/Thr kinase [Atopobacter sp. AH10]|uniref:Stk1 family PASTA domain-containing Ser/Thr kinase n=1 Tax=Atopobacter sp. AH10 TaxID=2315861 RepID=UPI000EF1CF64|nr:Stk1 family PASTA domain-containing Ser/Thr kinase [Atopobacter sp. AH10]RLK64044.1 Stk1 family PASTA domain-containing Ser/Thr kinase [Atopobacter sp. AH10]
MISIGDKVGGRYKIIDHIGSGGMSNVYLGHDLILNRFVAVKVLRFDFQDNKDSIRRFKREALSAAQLTHPNIVAVYDVDEENGQQYIVMEYNDGEDLKDYIKKHGPIEPKRAVFIMKQLLEALSLAHQNRIIHRDIKSQNVLIDHHDHVQLTDFGIAVALSDTSVTQTNTLLGSVHYLSPEQARGSRATIQSDIYALGIVMYEILVGKVPFDGDSPVSIALKHFQEDLPSIRSQIPQVPQALENVCLRATAKNPAVRYKSCQEMYNDISTAMDSKRKNEAKFDPKQQGKKNKVRVVKPVAELLSETKSQKDMRERIKSQHLDKMTKAKKPVKTSRRRKVHYFLLAILMMAMLGTLWVFLHPRSEQVEVPILSQMTLKRAEENLKEAGLTLGEIKKEKNDVVQKGYVIRSNPAEGKTVKKGSKVSLIVSSGKKLVTIEDYTGKSYSSVRKKLDKLGFNVERYEEASDNVKPGIIIDQDLKVGKKVDPHTTTIALTVSTGLESVSVANLSGYSEQEVRDYAQNNGFDLKISYASSDEIEKGFLVSQNPEAGSPLPFGGTLSVVISSGPSNDKKSLRTVQRWTRVSYLPKDGRGNSSNHIEVFIEDQNHKMNKPVQSLEISESTDINLTFELKPGQVGKYMIKRDGVIIEQNANVTG